MNRIITTLLGVLCLSLPLGGLVLGAQERKLDVAFSFTPTEELQSLLTGYALHQGGSEVCSVSTAEVTTTDADSYLFSCSFMTEDGTFDFTLSATYSNSTQSPLSPPFSFTIEPPSVENQLPQADFSASPTSGECPLTVALDGTESSDSDGTISSYSWSFSDGTSSTGSSTDHTFSNAGTHSITLQVTDNDGGTGDATQTVTCTEPPPVENQLPQANFIASPTSGECPLTVALDGSSSSDSDGTISSYSWSYSDGTSSTGSSTDHTFNNAGTHSITLQVTDNDNGTGDATQTVTCTEPPSVENQLPQANFIASPTSGECPLTVALDGSSSSDSDGTISSYSWSFSDGTSSTGSSTDHTFSNAGSHSITLQVTDNDGGTGDVTQTVTCSEPLTTPAPEVGTSGTRTITYSWNETSASDVAGYRMYMNETMLCETNSPTDTTLSCTANLISIRMVFSVTSFDTNGNESAKSNILVLDPADYPELFVTKNLSFNFTYSDSASSSGGFRVYNNNVLACESSDPTTRRIDCETVLVPGANRFAILAVDLNDIETLVSNTIVYHSEITTEPTTSPPVQETLDAIFTATPQTGEAPLSVAFDAAGSTGDISTYAWTFGDGDTGSGMVAEHIYSLQGTYTATLTVTDKDGATDTAQVTVTVESGSTAQSPPSAVISSTNAVGEAPLEVGFDGSGSDTTCPPLTYSWDFGDGQPPGSGELVTHSYFVAGTYSAELTVSDCNGLTDTVGTPVIVTSTVSENQLPTAKISATPISGECPLTVSLDGSSSSDSDGTISKYNWNFGDGTGTIGSKVQHTFNSPASYTITLQVTDNDGGVGEATQTVACAESPPETGLKIEVGELTIADEWASVAFEKSFTEPVVVVGPPTSDGSDPVVVQIRNVNQAGFEIRLKEWMYLDGQHVPEKVSYVVLEQGTHTLKDGNMVEAGFFDATTKKVSVNFQKAFTVAPVVLSTVSSENDSQPVTGRIQKISTENFNYNLQEEENEVQSHPSEKVAYIAWTPGVGVENGFAYEAGTTPNTVSHEWSTLIMTGEFTTLPFLLADMQTRNGRDPAALRHRNLSMLDAEVKVQEEQSKDDEIKHTTEAVGYLILGAQD